MNESLPNFVTAALAFQDRNLAVLQDDSSANCPAILVASPRRSTDQTINEILRLTQGLTFVAITPERATALNLEPMITRSPTKVGSQLAEREMCVSVEAREGVTTGISAADRSVTIRALTEDPPVNRRLVKPGHIFPVVVRVGGVLVKHALPEAARDLVRLFGDCDSALFVDLLDHNGELMDRDAQLNLSTECKIPIITLSSLVRHRLENEQLVERVSESTTEIPLVGQMQCVVYRSSLNNTEQIALIKGRIDSTRPILTRVQPARTFGDVFAPNNYAYRSQILASLSAITKRGEGVVVYLERRNSRHEQLQELSQHSVLMMREYGIGAQVLRDLGVRQVDLLTGTQRNLAGLTTFGINIASQIGLNTDNLGNLAV